MRIRSLDSIRGLAAVVVLLYHCMMMAPEHGAWLRATPLRLFVSGPSAVTVFFVLSGFVLYFAIASRPAYLPYLLKRMLRIYPPFGVAILISAILYWVVEPTPVATLSDWFNSDGWQLAPTPSVMAGHLAMTDIDAMHSLDGVMWSLVPEIRISILFPLVVLAVRRTWSLTLAASLLVSIVSALWVRTHPVPAVIDLPRTMQYLFVFTVGAVLAHHHRAIRAWVGSLPAWQTGLGWGAALALLMVPPTSALGLVTALGAILAVALGDADRRVARVLDHPVPLWLGRVSYSLYLVHMPVLLTLGHLLGGRIALPAVAALACAISLGAAEILYRLVEAPSIQLGRAVVARRSGRAVVAMPGAVQQG